MPWLQPLPQLCITITGASTTLHLSFIKAWVGCHFFLKTSLDTFSQTAPSSTPQGDYLKFYLTLILLAWQWLVSYPLHLPKHHKLFEGTVYRIPDYIHTPKHTHSSYSTHGCWMFWKVRMVFVWIKQAHSVRFQRQVRTQRKKFQRQTISSHQEKFSNRFYSVTEGPWQYHRKGSSTGKKSSSTRQADGFQHQGKSLPLKDSKILGTSLVVQWLRIHLPMQGTWVWSLVEEPGSHMWRGN